MNYTAIYHISHLDLDGYSCLLLSKELSKTGACVVPFTANYGGGITARINQVKEIIINDFSLPTNSNNLSKDNADVVNVLVLITDLNLTIEQADLFNSLKELDVTADIDIKLLDHHPTGKDAFEKYPEWYHLDRDKSGTLLTYEFVHNLLGEDVLLFDKKYALYVDMVNTYDLWKKDKRDKFEMGKVATRWLSNTKHVDGVLFNGVNIGLKLHMLEELRLLMEGLKNNKTLLLENHEVVEKAVYDKERDFYKSMTVLEEGVPPTLDNYFMAIYVQHLKHEIDKNIMIYTDDEEQKEYKFFVVPNAVDFSSVGNAVLESTEAIDFIMSFNTVKGTMSFRGKGRLDLGIVASKLFPGGGGHPNASGARCKLPRELFTYEEVIKFLCEKVPAFKKQ